jgi:hypothetical protein
VKQARRPRLTRHAYRANFFILDHCSRELQYRLCIFGGEPDVALNFPTLFRAVGLHVIETHPRLLTVSPSSYVWQWPASFIEINLTRLHNLGRVTSEWVEEVRREFKEAESDPTTLLTTPMFLEIIARRE